MRGKLLFRDYDENSNIIKMQCGKCGQIKSIDCFNKDKSQKDGYHTTCKSCRAVYRLQNKDKRFDYDKEYYNKNRDKILERKKEYYKNKKEEQK